MNQEEQKTGPFIGVIIIIILLALGGFYLWREAQKIPFRPRRQPKKRKLPVLNKKPPRFQPIVLMLIWPI